jgi:hypothetical protein
VAEHPPRRLPLLPLPAPEAADRAKRGRGFSKFRLPPHGRQVERIGPKLPRLLEAFERRRIELRAELAGAEPELALVMETIGSVDRFVNAVRRIPEMEWLGEVEEELIPPDEDFQDARDPKKQLSGCLYLVMTDRRAIEELLSLWERYRNGPAAPFGRGFTPFKTAFAHLREIRFWGPEDRIRETGILDDWRERLQAGPETVRAELELWYRGDLASRTRRQQVVHWVVEAAGGRVLAQSVIPEIAYHGLLAEVPSTVAETMLESLDVALVKCDEVMFVRPVGQVLAVPSPDASAPSGPPRGPAEAAEPGPPIVALFDGLPVEGHTLLAGRLDVDDPEGWAAEAPARHRSHGTAMASLILHGDLSAGGTPLGTRLYVRPILRPLPWPSEPPPEQVPEDVLLVDLFHRAVRRLFEGEGTEPPAAPTVQILNLSVGDPSRPFDRFISPWARLLDWLAWQYRLLVIVSAGNHPRPLSLSAAPGSTDLPEREELRRLIYQALWSDAHLRRLLAPAEAANALTAGGEHADDAGAFSPGPRLDPCPLDRDGLRLPSPVSAVGPGLGRAIKPEVLFPAGRQLFEMPPGSAGETTVLRPSRVTGFPPGQRSAAPGAQPGELSATRYLCGTSNAAALASRAAARICERFPDLLDGYEIDQPPERRYLAPLLKAFLAHGAHWGKAAEVLRDLPAGQTSSRASRATLARLLGYGFADEERVMSCWNERVTLVGWNELAAEEGHIYRVPLPPSLSGKPVWKRLVITLAWLTPIQPRDRRYRRAQLWFEPGAPGRAELKELLAVEGCEADSRTTGRGTLQHEVFEGARAAAFTGDDHLAVKVSCREHAPQLKDKVPYGLLVTLEVAPGVDIPIYEEVRLRLRPRVPVEP